MTLRCSTQGERRKIAEFSAGASNSSVSGGGAMPNRPHHFLLARSPTESDQSRPSYCRGHGTAGLDQLNTTLDNQAYTRSQIQKFLDSGSSPPTSASFAFVSGCQMAHVCCLAAARHALLLESGWNVERQGLCGAPPLRILASNRHGSVERAVRLLGLGEGNILDLDLDRNERVTADVLRTAGVAENGTQWQSFEKGSDFDKACKLLMLNGLLSRPAGACSRASDKPEVYPCERPDKPDNGVTVPWSTPISDGYGLPN